MYKNKFEIDYNALSETVNQRKIKLSSVANQIEKVAFDVVRFKDSDSLSKLWQIHQENGEDYIVAMYTDEDPECEWSVKVSNASAEFYYKNQPLMKLSSRQIGINPEELHLLQSYLPRKLSENQQLTLKLLKLASPETQHFVKANFPELLSGQK